MVAKGFILVEDYSSPNVSEKVLDIHSYVDYVNRNIWKNIRITLKSSNSMLQTNYTNLKLYDVKII